MNSNSKLANLDHQLFTGLINLKFLSLRNSSLSTLDPRLANLFKKMSWIQLSSRKFNCNCSVQWLNALLNKIRTNSNKNVTLDLIDKLEESILICSSPDSVSGANLIELTTEQLGCYEVKSFLPVIIAIVVAIFILIAVIIICVLNCRSSSTSSCIKNGNANKHHEDLNSFNKFNTGDHLVSSLHSFSSGNGSNLINNTNNYAFKLGLYDGINRTATGKQQLKTKLRQQNKVFSSTSDKPIISELPRFDTMYKPMISPSNFSDILMPNSKSTLINTNKLIKHQQQQMHDDQQSMIKCLTNPYQVSGLIMPPGYETTQQDSYFIQQQQQLLFNQQQKTTNTLHPAQFMNHHFNQTNFQHSQLQPQQQQQQLLLHRHKPSYQSQTDFTHDENEDYSDHTYATVLNGNEIYIGSQEVTANQINRSTFNQTINPSHLLRLANSDCSSCSSGEPLSRLSNEKPITEL